MKAALILIDIQNDYFPGGKMELDGAVEAGATAGKLLEAARRAGVYVCHVQHVSKRAGSTFFLPGTSGAEIHAGVAPRAGEPLFVKHVPNSFRETGLDAALKERQIKTLYLAGMMSHMCVDATTRAAWDLGYECVVAHDACATRSLTWNGVTVPAPQVHAAFMSALNVVYARVHSAEEILQDWK